MIWVLPVFDHFVVSFCSHGTLFTLQQAPRFRDVVSLKIDWQEPAQVRELSDMQTLQVCVSFPSPEIGVGHNPGPMH